MGLLDEVGKMLGGSAGAEGGQLLPVLQQLLSQNGGMEGLMQKFQAAGLGNVLSSWLSQGQNLPISSEQIQKVLGSEQVSAIAGKLGVDPQQAAAQLAKFLPEVIDKLSPDGKLPAGGGDLLAQGAGLLKGLFKS